MRIIKSLIIVAGSLVGFLSCNDRFEEVNTNPNGVSDADPQYLFATAARESFRSGTGGAYEYRVCAQMAHFYVGVNNDHLNDQYQQDLSGESYEDLYNSEYKSKLKYYNEILMLTAPGQPRENEFQYAVSDVMAVLAYSTLTDAFGDIPYFEGAFGNAGKISPVYDSQVEIYHDMLDRLTKDIDGLKTADGTVGLYGQDPVFKDDPDLWISFANSLRLRLAMRIRHVDPATATEYLSKSLADPLMTSLTQEALSINVDGENSQLFSPWFGTFDFWNFRISDKLVTQLASTNDPRLHIYAKPMSNGSYKGMINGLTDDKFGAAVNMDHSFPGDYLVGKAATTYLFTSSEVAFLQAESALFGLGGSDANGHYRRGIELALRRSRVAEADITAFMASPTATLSGTPEEQFEQIGIQMWLAFAPNFKEAYSYMRRTGYPVIPQRDGVITSLGDTEGILPSRVIYPLTEKLRNSTNVQSAIDNLDGGDVLTSKVWWDVRD